MRTPLLGAKPLLGLLVAAFAVIRPAPAQAFSPYLVMPDPDVAEATPAYRYANMTDAEVLAELDRRKILYTKLEGVPGVRAPVRLTGRLHGVYIHSSLPPDQRVTSPFEILDARLLLALDDFAVVLERHDIDSAHVQEVGGATVGDQIGLGDLELDTRGIRVTSPRIVHRDHETVRLRAGPSERLR